MDDKRLVEFIELYSSLTPWGKEKIHWRMLRVFFTGWIEGRLAASVFLSYLGSIFWIDLLPYVIILAGVIVWAWALAALSAALALSGLALIGAGAIKKYQGVRELA